MVNYEVYEDNGGSVYLVILEGTDPVAIFENYECTPLSLKHSIDALAEDATAYETWDGNLMERLARDGSLDAYGKAAPEDVLNIEDVYENLYDLVAHSEYEDGKMVLHPDKCFCCMGKNVKDSLGIIICEEVKTLKFYVDEGKFFLLTIEDAHVECWTGYDDYGQMDFQWGVMLANVKDQSPENIIAVATRMAVDNYYAGNIGWDDKE